MLQGGSASTSRPSGRTTGLIGSVVESAEASWCLERLSRHTRQVGRWLLEARMGSTAPWVFLITGADADCGKSTTAAIVGRAVGCPVVSTSALIAADLERCRGLEPGTIARDRLVDRNAWRAELGEHGVRMASQGRGAATLAVQGGASVIEGCRRGRELTVALAAARRLGRVPFALHVVRRGVPPTDNTEAVALARLASRVIWNVGTLDELERLVHRVVGECLEVLDGTRGLGRAAI